MEQITKRDGIYYYGECKCVDIDDAYERFRNDHNKSAGRNAFSRLDRIGQRRERVLGFGFVFESRPRNFGYVGTVPYHIIGLVHICYCRISGRYDYPDLEDEEFEQWFDWAFSKGSGCMRRVGSNSGTGRSRKRRKPKK